MTNKFVDIKKATTKKESIILFDNLRISILKKNLLRVEVSENNEFVDEPTQSIINRKFPFTDYSYKIHNKIIEIKINNYKYFINAINLSESYVLFKGKKVFFNNDYNLRSTTRTLDMSPEGYVHFDNRVTGEHEEIFYKEKRLLELGVVSTNGMAILDDKDSLIIDSKGNFRKSSLLNDLYVFFNPLDYEEAVKSLYELTGFLPLLPKFVFGNWWSRYYEYNQKSYLALMNKFKEKNIPLSVSTIDMDWHYVDVDNEFGISEQGLIGPSYGDMGGWTGFTWNKHLFPSYKKFLEELHNMGLKVTLNLHPSAGIRFFEKDYDMFADAFNVNKDKKETVFFDFTDKKFVNLYFKMLHEYEKDGVDFWWIDWQQGSKSKIDGFDPLRGLNYYHYYDANRDNKRNVILSRYSGVGSHRYPLGFSGDTIQTWDVLKYVIYFTANSSNIGYTMWSHDVGAHHAGIRDPELYIRWLQFALYNPIMRLHSCKGELSSKEPWYYPYEYEVLAEDILRERHRLIPYLYTQNYLNHSTGKCFIRPLYYLYPKDNECYLNKYEHFLGDILVAPITDKINDNKYIKHKVYLPEGIWIDLNNNVKYKGNRYIESYYSLGDIPRYIKEGSIVYKSKNLDIDKQQSTLEIILSLGNGKTFIYEDDGFSNEYKKGKFNLIEVEQKRKNKCVDLVIKPLILEKNPAEPHYFFIKILNPNYKKVSGNIEFSEDKFDTYSILKLEKVSDNFEIKLHFVIEDNELLYLKTHIKEVLIKHVINNLDADVLINKIYSATDVEQIKNIIFDSSLGDIEKTMLNNLLLISS